MNDQICDEVAAYIGVYKYAHDLYSGDQRWMVRAQAGRWPQYLHDLSQEQTIDILRIIAQETQIPNAARMRGKQLWNRTQLKYHPDKICNLNIKKNYRKYYGALLLGQLVRQLQSMVQDPREKPTTLFTYPAPLFTHEMDPLQNKSVGGGITESHTSMRWQYLNLINIVLPSTHLIWKEGRERILQKQQDQPRNGPQGHT